MRLKRLNINGGVGIKVSPKYVGHFEGAEFGDGVTHESGGIYLATGIAAAIFHREGVQVAAEEEGDSGAVSAGGAR